ncbi:MAG: hypothetical protein KUG77_28085 [Nannocystaceae bacterium]|nr:hypothetical protein [Nannocystaceae bacterium]
MVDRRHALLPLLLCACLVTGNAGVFEAGTSTSGTGGQSTTSDATGEGSTFLDEKLDVQAGDIPIVECSSIEQTTTIVERPSDILMIADDDVSRQFLQSNITNLLPAMETQGVFDANVILVVDGPPPPDTGEKFTCGAWNCRGASGFEAFTVVQHAIEPGMLFGSLFQAQSAWTPILRAASWKHVWVFSSTQSDASGSADDLLADLIDAADSGLVVHATVSERGVGDPEGFLGLTTLTGGTYAQGGFNLNDFIDPMIDRIRGTSLACEYDIPAPPPGHIFEPDKVNVDYDDGDGLQVVGNVAAAGDCASVVGGWYYDDTLDPEQVVMCPQTCTRFEELREASIEIRFGCTTIPAR